MSDILLRDLDTRTVGKLKAIARRHGRSLQSEIKAILNDVVSFLTVEAASVSAKWHKNLTNKKQTDSSELIREDRKR